MTKKIFAFLTAFSLITAIPSFAVSADETTDGEKTIVTETAAEKAEPPVTETTSDLTDKPVKTTEVTTTPTETTTPDISKELLAEIERLNGEKTDNQDFEPNTEPNGYLVEKVEKSPDKRDFITVSTRDGHVFYIVIEYEGDNKKVYFLNTVDTADLQYLLETNSTSTTTFNAEPEKKTTEPKTAKTMEDAKKTETDNKKNSNTFLYIVGAIAIAAFVFIARKKLSGGKKKFNDDEDSSDDYTEEEPEVYVNEDNQEDDYE